MDDVLVENISWIGDIFCSSRVNIITCFAFADFMRHCMGTSWKLKLAILENMSQRMWPPAPISSVPGCTTRLQLHSGVVFRWRFILSITNAIDERCVCSHDQILGNFLLRSDIGTEDRRENPCVLCYLIPRAYDVLVRIFLFLLRVDSCFDLHSVSASPRWRSFPKQLLDNCDCDHD